MNESGDRLNAAYRALAREEPRAAIDDAILAASRRAVAKPSASRRWAAPFSIAAVLVLAFGVTLHMREESPGIESPDVSTRQAPPPAAPAVVPAEQFTPTPERKQDAAPPPGAKLQVPDLLAKKKPFAQSKPDGDRARATEERDRGFRDEVQRAEPERKDTEKPNANVATEPALQKESKVMQAPMPQAPAQAARQMTAPAAPASPPASAAAPAMVAPPPKPAAPYPADRAAAAPAAAASADAAAPAAGAARLKREVTTGVRSSGAVEEQADEFTRELEAIAKLRVEGRREEADKALEEFRRKHPGYRIPDAMWERVKPR